MNPLDVLDVGDQRSTAVGHAWMHRGHCWRCQRTPTDDPMATCPTCRDELVEGGQ